LARVFPDGRTVHIPSDGSPLPGYELARADIEKRGNGDAAPSKSKSLFAVLFGGKSNDEDDEGANAPVVSERASSTGAKATEPVPMPRAKPLKASTLQLASADVQIVQPGKSKPAAPADTQGTAAERTGAKPQTPADIINARGFWDDIPATPNQATPAQVAAIGARRALASADPQPTASVSAAFEALAYAPASSSPVDRSKIVAASAPLPNARPASAHNSMTVTDVTTVVAKGLQGGSQGEGSTVATSTRIAISHSSDVWMRAMILAPSASASMSTTVLGDADMTLMRAHFVKPQSAVAMTFSDDPLMGMVCDSFTGSAVAVLATKSFVMRTASLR
jgi:hypothetical protein